MTKADIGNRVAEVLLDEGALNLVDYSGDVETLTRVVSETVQYQLRDYLMILGGEIIIDVSR